MLIAGFQPFSLSDFPGKTAAIIFTQGCNFRCPYCHNKQLWSRTIAAAAGSDTDRIIDWLGRRAGLVDGVVITGGEPTLQPDLESVISRLKEMDLMVKLDSNGSRPEVLLALFQGHLLDFVAMDIKAPLRKYGMLAGVHVDNRAILASIAAIRESGVPHQFRTTWDKARLDEDDLAAIRAMIPDSNLLVQACKPFTPTM